MALQIANQSVVAKIERLAKATGLSKTAAVERAVDRMMAEEIVGGSNDPWTQMQALLDQIDRVPEIASQFEPLEWDEHGLPR
jgi:antitoxin VapB